MSRKALILVALLAATGVAYAQLRVDVQLVNVVATVTDDRGRYVTDLTADDFTVAEDGRPRQITHFDRSNDLPVSVGIVLDTSVSMKPKIVTAIQAVDGFIRDIHSDDDIFFVTFDEKVHLRQDFTSDRSKLSKVLEKVKLSYGTALYDGVFEGLDRVRKGKHPKKALLLLSDGVDSVSEHEFREVRTRVREGKALVYALGIAPDLGESADTVDMMSLDVFSGESGGKAWLVAGENRKAAMENALGTIADELRSQYTLGYYPDHNLKDGKWHRVEIRLRKPGYTIRYKQEYLGQ